MFYSPGENPRIDQLAADQLASTAEALGLASADQLPAQQGDELPLGRLAAQAAASLFETQHLYETNQRAVETLFRSYIPSVVAARAAADDIALTQGQFTRTDEASLAQTGSGLKDIREYLAPFTFQSEASLPEDVPPLSIGTILRLKGAGIRGQDCYVSNLSSMYGMTENATNWPSMASKFGVPVLVDSTIYILCKNLQPCPPKRQMAMRNR